MCRDHNIENDLIPKIASCFGGGIGNTGNVCGAVIGAIMAIGVVRNQYTSIEEWLKYAEITQELLRRFENEMKTISCRELIGFDLRNEEDRKKLMTSDVSMKVCLPAVSHAYQIVSELLQNDS